MPFLLDNLSVEFRQVGSPVLSYVMSIPAIPSEAIEPEGHAETPEERPAAV